MPTTNAILLYSGSHDVLTLVKSSPLSPLHDFLQLFSVESLRSRLPLVNEWQEDTFPPAAPLPPART